MFDAQLLAFVVVAVALTLTPGPDMALVLRNTVRGGRSSGFRTIAGIAVGLVLWATATALGIAAVLAASAAVFTALKIAGGVYLVYLGVQALRSLRRGEETIDAPKQRGSPFRQGLFTNLLNPKLAVLFTTLLPQFISPDDPALAKSILLATVFVTIGLAWLCTYVLIVGLVARSRAFRRVTEALSGIVLVALGARLVFER
ncbi:MAG TPA: LysE family translocator [Gaiellaceae bacterium]|jgi:RhtB (resistance to homoserine/threonine) family protein|nr:LysE family translocator [Gaiellaceae bacterium]